jgi:hypothetical protein
VRCLALLEGLPMPVFRKNRAANIDTELIAHARLAVIRQGTAHLQQAGVSYRDRIDVQDYARGVACLTLWAAAFAHAGNTNQKDLFVRLLDDLALANTGIAQSEDVTKLVLTEIEGLAGFESGRAWTPHAETFYATTQGTKVMATRWSSVEDYGSPELLRLGCLSCLQATLKAISHIPAQRALIRAAACLPESLISMADVFRPNPMLGASTLFRASYDYVTRI